MPLLYDGETDEPVGGYDDISALDKTGELDQKLGL